MNKGSKKWFWIFTGPVLATFTLVVLIPIIMGIGYSFTSWNGISSQIDFVGLDNYKAVFKDKDFFNSFLFTAKFAIVSVISINLVGFLLALLVTSGLKGSHFLRGIFFIPNLIGGLILGFVWQFIFTKGFDAIGAALGIEWLRGWLSTETTGFWGLIILMTWQMAGYMMIIYVAGLQNIPDSVLEAAAIDGASKWDILRRITLPLVAPSFTVGLFLTLANSFKLYDQNLSLTGGGPGNSTQMVAMNIYKTAFTSSKFGLAQSKAVIFLVVLGIVAITQMYLSKKREVEM
ncbi:ABC transporter permease [Sporanaerobium hydrogeniformans]|uniref:ABC transporter permease n=1 Tax=Sporanaerobium hydrogeniformans TaxID=3072179 RepID=A0AC61DAD6_9FIRM|nr:sugar ABC transporter permease [Sporanaerobium hydrogeniformans]PHV70314.1 ABC transporter permease [Sporanaerobium hydrogeniformans]